MSFSTNVNLSKISATNLQNNLSNQINNQIASARTRWAPSFAKNVADQVAPNKQRGDAHNRLWVGSRARIDTNVKIRNVNAANVQENNARQVSNQKAHATSVRGYTLAKNTLVQNAKNRQYGNGYNNIDVTDRSKWSTVNIRDINAVNQQSNGATQVNTQKAISSTLGWDPAQNGAWQTATNYQGGSAYNHINVNV